MSPRWLHWPASGGETVLMTATAQLLAWSTSTNQWSFDQESFDDGGVIASTIDNWDIDGDWIRMNPGSGYANASAFYSAYPTAFARITIGGNSWDYTQQNSFANGDFQWQSNGSGPTVAEAESGGTLGFASNDSVTIEIVVP